ncbi:MAG TPA: acyl-CoA dehydrogenase family protein [Myxococcota bacterium]|nr:acyl-CoA dehydrogenase family protein [Myxococcota bacterium]
MSAPGNPFTRIIGNFNEISKLTTIAGGDDEECETIDLLLNAITRFAKKHVDAARIDAEAAIPAVVIERAAEMGLFGITIPAEFGGTGLSMKGACRVIEALSNADSSLGVTIGLHSGLGLRGLCHLGSRQLKQRYLPDLAGGKKIACFPVTESEAGSDIAAVRTTAIEDGHELVINGSKIFVTNGGLAGLSTIVARTPGLAGSRRGHSMILVPLDLPGVERGAEEHKLGIRGSSTISLHFDNVRVGRDHILGTPSRGLDHLNHVLSWGRTLMAAGSIGLAKKAAAKTLEQVTSRRQFNRVIGEFGMVREMVATMRCGIQSMENVIRLTTRLEDESPGSIGWESSVAKVFCSETAWRIADDSVQLHGGSGFIEDTGVARLMRDCRISRIFEGANELLRFHIASAALTWKSAYLAETPPLRPLLSGPLGELGGRFDELFELFSTFVAGHKKRLGLKVFTHQMDQRRIADAASGLYLMLCDLARAQGELARDKLTDDMLMRTRLAAYDYSRCIESSLGGLGCERNRLASQIAAAECARVGCQLENDVE